MLTKRYHLLVILGIGLMAFAWSTCQAAEEGAAPSDQAKLVRAVLCERIEDFEPVQIAVVFSIDAGQISCFTSFDAVPDTTFVLHKWYRRDALVTSKRLTLKSPSWSTYSSIQLREADKGPWRVDIYNANNKLLKTLRFSVSD
jgi:hypothetical protein